jgi:hypothetical protein
MIVLQCRGKDIIGINMLVIGDCLILRLISSLVCARHGNVWPISSSLLRLRYPI